MAQLGFVSRVAHWLRGENEETTLLEEAIKTPHAPAEEDIESFGPAGIEPWPTPVAERQPQQPSAADVKVQELLQRFDQTADAVAEMRDRLVAINETLADLPQAARTQIRLTSAIHDQLKADETQTKELLALVREIPRSNAAQIKALERTNQLIDEAMKTVGPLVLGFNRLAGTLESMAEAGQRQLMAVGILADRQERALREQRADFQRQHKVVLTVMACVGLAALAGLVVSLCLLVR